jgi:hypothetical protein
VLVGNASLVGPSIDAPTIARRQRTLSFTPILTSGLRGYWAACPKCAFHVQATTQRALSFARDTPDPNFQSLK